MPASDAHTIRSDVRADWERVATGWQRWESAFAGSTWPVTQSLLLAARITPGMRVLDIGCGTGDTVLAAARQAGDDGSVLGVDLSESMLAVCRDRASALKLPNIDLQAVAIEDVPTSAGPFDAIVARFSIIFLADASATLRHLRDLLKPGGRMAAAVWTPPAQNPMFGITLKAMRKVIDVPQPEPDAPGPHRFSADGELEHAFRQAGLDHVHATVVPFYNFAPDPETYWRMICDISPRLSGQLTGLSDEQRQTVRNSVIDSVCRYQHNGVVRVPARARVGSGRRPTT